MILEVVKIGGRRVPIPKGELERVPRLSVAKFGNPDLILTYKIILLEMWREAVTP